MHTDKEMRKREKNNRKTRKNKENQGKKTGGKGEAEGAVKRRTTFPLHEYGAVARATVSANCYIKRICSNRTKQTRFTDCTQHPPRPHKLERVQVLL
jgi:hypothetical protein